jgi:bacterioferritin-associated ferredoxin
MKIKAELDGRDFIEVDCEDPPPSGPQVPGAVKKVLMLGCSDFMELIHKMKKNFGLDPSKWPLPEGKDHSTLLVREMILKLRGEWQFPYPHSEVCHCRTVSAHQIDQAVIAGAHSTEVVTRLTSASTACGTCRPEVQKIIDYRLDKQNAS